MPHKPQCPFCLKTFESVEQLTSHLIFDTCTPQPEAKARASQPIQIPQTTEQPVPQQG